MESNISEYSLCTKLLFSSHARKCTNRDIVQHLRKQIRTNQTTRGKSNMACCTQSKGFHLPFGTGCTQSLQF